MHFNNLDILNSTGFPDKTSNRQGPLTSIHVPTKYMYQYAQKNSGYNTSIKKICSEKKDLVMFRFRKFLHEGFLLGGRL